MVKSLLSGKKQKKGLKDKKKKDKGGLKDAAKNGNLTDEIKVITTDKKKKNITDMEKQNTKDKKKTKNLQKRIEETEKLTTSQNLVTTKSKKRKTKLEEDIEDEVTEDKMVRNDMKKQNTKDKKKPKNLQKRIEETEKLTTSQNLVTTKSKKRKTKLDEDIEDEVTEDKMSPVPKMEFTIPSENAGRVIGKGGSNIKRITQESGARVSVKDFGEGKMCAITGSKESIKKAKSMIDDCLKNDSTPRKRSISENNDAEPKLKKMKASSPVEKMEFTIPSENAGRVIGKGGSNIKRITQESGARVSVMDIEEGKMCTITGSKKSMNKAKSMIDDCLESPVEKMEFIIPSENAGRVIGRGGSNIKRITQESGARVSVMDIEEGKMCTITGSKKSMNKAKSMIDDCLEPPSKKEVFTIPSADVGKVIGNGGSIIKEIIKKSGAHIKLEQTEEERICSISGSEESIKSARSLIDEYLSKPPSKKEVFTIPSADAGKVIGNGGSIIKEIIKKSGAHIKLEQTEEERICSISGSEEAIKLARSLIDKNLTKPPSKKEVFTIPSADVGKVIGKGGSIIKEIIKKSHAHIKLEQAEEGRICSISGSEESIKSARSLIDKYLTKVTNANEVLDKVSISKVQKGKIIGKEGKNIARIQFKTGAKVWIVKAEDEENDNICGIRGSKKSVKKARRIIEKLLSEEKPDKTVEPDESGEETKIEDDRIVRSVDDDSDLSDTDEEEEPGSNVEVPILVSSSCVQTLLDNRKFKKLQTESIAKIVIDMEEDQEEIFCRISGEEKDVMETKKQLQKILQKVEIKEEKEKPTLQIASSLTWDTEFKLPKTNKGESSSEDSDEEEVQKPVKKSKGEMRREKLEEEKQLYEYERKKLEGEIIPETADDFDRLVVNSPDSSVVWLRYMAFHLETSEFDKARSVAERALKTISFREEREKQNIWVAYLNLENMYGTNETIGKVLARAITQCEPLDVYLPLVDIYVESSKIEEAERLYSVMTKKYSTNKMVWTKFAEFFFQQNRPESARKLLQRSLKSLENRHHVETITKFAQMEFKHGEPERGKTMFENILNTYPKRTDIWSVYVDLLTKMKDNDVTRGVYKRMIGLKLSAKKIKFFFKKYLEFEEKYGNEAQIAEVKEKALQYVESGGTID